MQKQQQQKTEEEVSKKGQEVEEILILAEKDEIEAEREEAVKGEENRKKEN